MGVKGENGVDVDPALDDGIGLLASARCRCILYHFVGSDVDTASLDELCTHVLQYDPDASDEKSVATGLYHNSLPKLDAAGVIDFDGRSETIRYRGMEDLEPILSAIRAVESDR